MTRTLRIGQLIIVAACTGLAGITPAAGSPEPDSWGYSAAVTTLRTLDAGLDAGGDTKLASYHLRAEAEREINARTEVGVRFDYDLFDREISGPGALEALRHLEDTKRVGITGFLGRRTRFGWSYGLRPFVKWAFESGAFSEDAMSYGMALAAIVGLSSQRRIGIGARVSRNMEDETKIAPVFIVHWELSDNWSIANAREANFTSPAGLEIRYRGADDWRFALTGIYHSDDYRLDNSGPAAGGIGDSSGIVSYIRVTHRWLSWLNINGYAGAVFDGALQVEDAGGNRLAKSGYDTAPFVALSIEGKF